MTTTTQQLGVWGHAPPPLQKFCSKITSETIFGPKLATALTKTSVVHVLHLIAWGIDWVKASALLLTHLANIVTVRIYTKDTDTHSS